MPVRYYQVQLPTQTMTVPTTTEQMSSSQKQKACDFLIKQISDFIRENIQLIEYEEVTEEGVPKGEPAYIEIE